MLSLLIKPSSSLCNMRCKYCFYHDLSTHRDIAFRGIMTKETAESLIEKAFENERQSVLFAFQGGEPTLAGLDFFRHFVKTVKEKNTKKITVSYSLQTNGLVIDEEWANFLRKNRFLVGLSLDGSKSVHDDLRSDASGKPTFKRVLKAAKVMEENDVDFNILTVITPELALNIEKVYKSLKKHNFRFLQFIPCLNPLGVCEKLPHTLTDEQYYHFLTTLFDLWYEDFISGNYISIRYFDNLVFSHSGQGAEQCGMQGRCNIQYVIESDGAVYPCDFYCLDEYLLGNINTDSLKEMKEGAAARKFISSSKGYKNDCHICKCFKLCKSGCKRYKTDNEYIYCEAFKRFYENGLTEKLDKIMARLRHDAAIGGTQYNV